MGSDNGSPWPALWPSSRRSCWPTSPVANLDPTLAAAVVDDIVGQVREQHLTAVLNLHDVRLARRVALRLIGLRDGAVLFDRPAEQVSDDDLAMLYAGEPSAPVLEPAG